MVSWDTTSAGETRELVGSAIAMIRRKSSEPATHSEKKEQTWMRLGKKQSGVYQRMALKSWDELGETFCNCCFCGVYRLILAWQRSGSSELDFSRC